MSTRVGGSTPSASSSSAVRSLPSADGGSRHAATYVPRSQGLPSLARAKDSSVPLPERFRLLTGGTVYDRRSLQLQAAALAETSMASRLPQA
jgi:hypothetical protein